MLAAVDSKARVVGILGPDEGAGISTACRMLADSHFSSGAKTLLIDFSQSIEQREAEQAEDDEAWAPGDGPSQLIQSHKNGCDVLAVRPTVLTRPLFNNVEVLRRMFNEELAAYEAIIVDLPPVLHQRKDLINPLAAARACDAVIMVCMIGAIKHQRVKETLSVLDTAGIQLGGVVLNDLHNPTLAVEMAASTRRLAWFAPRLAAWIERKLLSSETLNSQS